MTALAWLIPCALALGALGLGGFLWSLRAGQFEDLEGAGWRALDDRPPDVPLAELQEDMSPAGPQDGARSR